MLIILIFLLDINQDLIKPLCTIKHKSIFAAKKFLTKTCNIMILYCRDFDKDSKKYLFVILAGNFVNSYKNIEKS